MTETPTTTDATIPLTDAELRQRAREDDFAQTATGRDIKTRSPRPRAAFERAADKPANPAAYDDQNPLAKMLINLLLMLTQLINPDNKSNGNLMSMFGKSFGYEDDANNTRFRALRDGVAERGRDNVRQELDYSRFDRKAASQTIRQSETQLTQAATGKNIYNSPLLEMIGKHESAGDYNRAYVPPKMPGSNGIKRVDLSNMTFNEVIQWQKNWVNEQRAAGIPADQRSSAIGKYQFIRTTLEATGKQLGLTGNEKMTPELQDRLAMQQLKNAGYDKFVAGKTSETAFLNKVAGVWSSIPQTNGASAHAGIGINAAGTSVANAVSTLQAERMTSTTAAFDDARNGKVAVASSAVKPAAAPTTGEDRVMALFAQASTAQPVSKTDTAPAPDSKPAVEPPAARRQPALVAPV